MTKDLKTILPELNPAQLKLLREWVENEIIGENRELSKKDIQSFNAEARVWYNNGWNNAKTEQRKQLEKLIPIHKDTSFADVVEHIGRYHIEYIDKEASKHTKDILDRIESNPEDFELPPYTGIMK